jgi:CysZ protein
MKIQSNQQHLATLSGNPLTRFLQGLGLPFHGLGFLLKRPKLWLFVIIPLVINIILFLVFLIWGYSGFVEFLKSRLGEGDNLAWYWKGLSITARIFFWLIALILVYFTFTPLALIISSPFNDQLAGSVEKAYGFEVKDSHPFFRKVAGEALFAVKSEIKRLFLFLMVFLIRHIPLKQKIKLLNRNLAFFMGFGLITTLFLMIPFLNVLAVSLSAVSGTIAFCSVYNKAQ